MPTLVRIDIVKLYLDLLGRNANGNSQRCSARPKRWAAKSENDDDVFDDDEFSLPFSDLAAQQNNGWRNYISLT